MNSTKSNLANKSKNKKSIFKNNNLSQLFKLISEKRGYFFLIIMTILFQLSITYFVSENFNIKEEEDKDGKKTGDTYFWLAFIAVIVMTLILAFINMPSWLKFILFSLISTAYGVLVSYRKFGIDPNIVKSALVGTGSIFVAMFVFGVALIASGIKLGLTFGLSLLFALLFIVFLMIVEFFIFNSPLLTKIIVIGLLMLFSIGIMFNTNLILQRDYNIDFISASLSYYLDIIGVFSSLLNVSELGDLGD